MRCRVHYRALRRSRSSRYENTARAAGTDVPTFGDRNWRIWFVAEGIELGVVENFVEPLVEGVTGRCGQRAAAPESLLPLSLLPRPHRHSSIVRPKHFQYYVFWTLDRAAKMPEETGVLQSCRPQRRVNSGVRTATSAWP